MDLTNPVYSSDQFSLHWLTLLFLETLQKSHKVQRKTDSKWTQLNLIRFGLTVNSVTGTFLVNEGEETFISGVD